MKAYVKTLPTSDEVREIPKPTFQNWKLKLPSAEDHKDKSLKSMGEQVSNNCLKIYHRGNSHRATCPTPIQYARQMTKSSKILESLP